VVRGGIIGHAALVVIEVACDESGSDGENLTGGNTDVFAHASVRLGADEAAEVVAEVRRRIRSPASEYKANHLLREKHRKVLVWFLGPDGPLHGGARVHLTDKAYFLLLRAADAQEAGDRDAAAQLYRHGPRAVGAERWREVLASLTAALRDSVQDGALAPLLDPLVPAVAATVRSWTADGTAVDLVHDRQNALTEEHIAWLHEQFPLLAGVRFVRAGDDARVQLADYLAGIARKVASDELNARGDTELTGLLRPYVDPHSVWADDRSRHALWPEGNPVRSETPA
jgi:hypothetical protein